VDEVDALPIACLVEIAGSDTAHERLEIGHATRVNTRDRILRIQVC